MVDQVGRESDQGGTKNMNMKGKKMNHQYERKGERWNLKWQYVEM